MRIRGYIAVFAVLAICVLPGIPLVSANSAFPHEYPLKAAFMYQFLSFVDGWESERETSGGNTNSANSDKSIIVGIIGEDPFQDAFAPLRYKRVKNKKVTIKYFKGLSNLNSQDKKVKVHPEIKDIRQCNLLFVCSSEKQYTVDILELIRNKSILTVADTEGFLEKGGIINFIIEKSKVRFEVNAAAARRAKLTIRSKLLRLAKRVLEQDDLGEK